MKRMERMSPRRLTTMVALALATTGCAMMGKRSAEADGVQIRVQNNLIPGTSLSVSVLPSVGPRIQVGFVAPSETKNLRFDPGTPAGPYRLFAETTEGAAIASRQFYLATVRAVEWNVSLNTVRLLETIAQSSRREARGEGTT